MLRCHSPVLDLLVFLTHPVSAAQTAGTLAAAPEADGKDVSLQNARVPGKLRRRLSGRVLLLAGIYRGNATASRYRFFSSSMKALRDGLRSSRRVHRTQEKLSAQSKGIHAMEIQQSRRPKDRQERLSDACCFSFQPVNLLLCRRLTCKSFREQAQELRLLDGKDLTLGIIIKQPGIRLIDIPRLYPEKLKEDDVIYILEARLRNHV